MKKFFFTLFIASSVITVDATPGTGGYLGHRIIIGMEGSYAPFYTSAKDFALHYDVQYGANVNCIVARRMQVGVFYNMWSLKNNELYFSSLAAGDVIHAKQFGVCVRTFRADRGGIAPIGKFYDVSLSYAMSTFSASDSTKNHYYYSPELMPKSSNDLMLHVAFGTQGVFWDHLVANTGLRFGYPVLNLGKVDESNYIHRRTAFKEYFSVFFGVALLI
ncbi:MAG: hypothetical protein HY064_01670 [Bacteroidetes bacterium]|nr:hypothetical protein [Bacteroidota bacterium]